MNHPRPPAPPAASDELATRLRRLSTGRNAPKAGRALGELGAAALPALRTALAHANPFVRAGSLHGFEAVAASGSDVLADVTAALANDADPRVRETACGVFERLGPAAVAHARGTLERAEREDPDARVRDAAARALARA